MNQKVCILNFSGNVGKSTVAVHMFGPRLNAPIISVESLNEDASAQSEEIERVRARHYNDLMSRVMKSPSIVVDVGSSNVEEFLKLMAQFAGSHEEFDLFVVPVVKDAKQQADTVNTIHTLAYIGVPAAKIRVLINKVDTHDDIRADFAAILDYADRGLVRASEAATVYSNEVFDMLKAHRLSLGALNEDPTDYRQALRDAKDEAEQNAAIQMIAMKRLAVTCTRNLDVAFEALLAA